MFLVLLKYLKPLDVIEQYVGVHREHLSRYYQSGELICSGPQVPREGGVILSKQKSKDQVIKMMSVDPFITEGVANYEIIEFTPVKYHENFAPLCSTEA